ncbi:hypothetical protein SAMN06264364_101363 [Quadrisphaera granulorum]|uniref:Uncharacterized protein n=1 Tax=Quadrisphaera granulorum TaxID=317664 RepID=A0A316AF25_9ACTN|nr:hypothetical protein BXY45_101363 [Quadrisphaera granulorum]SZE95019.1 hypothetical protein SAMN06264364_101363 [Quadrisphaera granulorum]
MGRRRPAGFGGQDRAGVGHSQHGPHVTDGAHQQLVHLLVVVEVPVEDPVEGPPGHPQVLSVAHVQQLGVVLLGATVQAPAHRCLPPEVMRLTDVCPARALSGPVSIVLLGNDVFQW